MSDKFTSYVHKNQSGTVRQTEHQDGSLLLPSPGSVPGSDIGVFIIDSFGVCKNITQFLINASAPGGIALNSGQILLGDATHQAVPVTPTGTVLIDDTGETHLVWVASLNASPEDNQTEILVIGDESRDGVFTWDHVNGNWHRTASCGGGGGGGGGGGTFRSVFVPVTTANLSAGPPQVVTLPESITGSSVAHLLRAGSGVILSNNYTIVGAQLTWDPADDNPLIADFDQLEIRILA